MTGEWCRLDRATITAPHASEATSRPPKSADAHPQAGALTRARASSPTAAASRAAPIRSGRPRALESLLSGTTLAASRTAARPTGRLIQNTHRQLICTRLPPMTGPSAAPSAPSADQVPMARARPAAGTDASKSDREAGTMRPAPAAWMTRAAISAATPGATPHSSEPRLKAASPAMNSRRRPTRSAHRPAGTSTAAKTIVYPLSTQDRSPRLVPAYCLPM